MAFCTSLSYHITFLTLALFYVPYASSSNARNVNFTAIFAFGDSYTDTGNTHSDTGPNGFMQVSKLPYGMTYFRRPTNRYTDGRLVIDFVAEALSLPYIPPYLNATDGNNSHGMNFAVAGATATDHSFFVHNNLTLNLTPQSILTELAWFRQFLKSKGCQDTKLQELLDMGAKYVVVEGAPPTGCLPLAMSLAAPDNRDAIGCVASANNQTSHHNSLLKVRINYLKRRHPQAIISYADYWNAYRTIMSNTKKYGFTEPFMTCCGSGGPPYNFDLTATCASQEASKACANPAQYINWDGVHLTEAMYKIVADMFLHGGYTQPPFDFLLSSRKREG